MSRRRSDSRLPDLVGVAARVFIDQGYRRTQMADVADALGVAKGTIYLYVESKEALFDFVLRHIDDPGSVEPPSRLPIPTPRAGATLRYVRERLAREPLVREIAAISGRRPRGDIADELEVVLAKVYDVLAKNRRSIKLADRCAADYPKLADIWFRGGREGLLGALDDYLDSRSRQGLRRFPDAVVRTRLVLETIVFWAVHRHWDPFPQPTNEPSARATVVRFLVAALVDLAKR
jgi:AcrR family transcriptional regulator